MYYLNYSIDSIPFHRPKAFIVRINECEGLNSRVIQTINFPVLNPQNPNLILIDAHNWAKSRIQTLKKGGLL